MKGKTFIPLLILLSSLPSVGAITYVDAGATGANNGTSWTNAFRTIQAGVDAANSLGGGEVWVKAGTYTGALNANPSDSFEVLNPNSVDILGEEKTLPCVTGGQSIGAHVTAWYLTGSLTVEVPTATFGSTTNQDSIQARLIDLRTANPNVLIWVNHPTRSNIAKEDLLAAANASALPLMEIQRNYPEDLQKWDFILANLDDQAGDCRKMVWGICSDDLHDTRRIDYKNNGLMLGSIPTAAQDPVYANRRLAAVEMLRRGSIVAMGVGMKCGVPTYTLTSSGGTAESINVTTRIDRTLNDSWVEIRFYGCDWATGSNPGTLLYSKRGTFGSVNSVTYCLTQTGLAGGTPLTAQQKANIRYIRPELVTGPDVRQHTFMEPVRIRTSGAWWSGPALTLAGQQATVGPSPYPVGGTDTGVTTYFNTHSHTVNSDGNSAAPTVRRTYLEDYAGLDAAAPKFDVVTDHDHRTPFVTAGCSVVLMKEGVHLYGGFSGNETSRDQRNWNANHTIIDGGTQGRCIYCDGSTWVNRSNATIDGFELKRGRAGMACGGGLRNWKSSPAVWNCTFTDNQALYGGAMCNSGSYATIGNCVFSGNLNPDSRSRGGAMMNDLASGPSISNCTFTGNQARRGAAVYEGGSATHFDACQFEGNWTADSFSYHGMGGAMYMINASTSLTNCLFRKNKNESYGDCSGGAIFVELFPAPTFESCRFDGNSATGPNGRGGAVYTKESSPRFVNCLFVSNLTPAGYGYGGAIYASLTSSPRIENSTMLNNTAFQGGAIYSDNSSPSVLNSIIAFNTEGLRRASGSFALTHNNVYGNGVNYAGAGPGSGDISADPLFVNRTAGDYHLTAWSPCVDAGENEPTLPAYDMEGKWRVWGGRPDMGALEYFTPAAKAMADGNSIVCGKAVVTAVFADMFYVESETRTYGNRVDKANHGAQVGMTVEVHGTAKTNDDGERYIEATSVWQDGVGTVKPIFMLNRSVGGGDWRYNPASGMGHKGIPGDKNLNNIGLFISTMGRVTYACPSYFYIDDGSALDDGSGHPGIRVLPYGLPVPAYDDRVEVTGVCSCIKLNGSIARLIRATSIESIGH